MLFYKSEKVFSKKGLKYTGLIISAGDHGKILSVRPDLISILWDKDKRQLARLCPPNNILKATEHSSEEMKIRAYYDFVVKNEIKFALGEMPPSEALKPDSVYRMLNQYWELHNLSENINSEYNKVFNDKAVKFINKMHLPSEREQLKNKLKDLMGEERYNILEKAFLEYVHSPMAKLAQNPKSLARQFMSEEDYDNFKKLLDLRKLYSEENVGRSEEGLKGTRTELKDINEKIDLILDKYKNTIMNEFDLKASSKEIDRIVKRAKKQPWSKPGKKEKLESQSIDMSNSADVEVENVKPSESNVLDYGQDPLAEDNYSGYSS